tara:strand:- start:1279 stop:1566 length:288 start_codon:yes stop_codon:yes gene_type:complete
MNDMKGNLKRDHRHLSGYSSLVSEIVTIALLDYKRKRVSEETTTAIRDRRAYSSDLIKKDRAHLRWFIFSGPMDLLLDLADLNVSPDRIRKEIER